MNHGATDQSFFEDFYDKSWQYSNNYELYLRCTVPNNL